MDNEGQKEMEKRRDARSVDTVFLNLSHEIILFLNLFLTRRDLGMFDSSVNLLLWFTLT